MKNLGFGLGLRTEHYTEILAAKTAGIPLGIDWFEVLTENYLVPGGKPLYYLDAICAEYPVALHGVSLSIGSADPLNRDYLQAIKELAKRTQAHWISDHLCWTGYAGNNMHDLLPLPYTQPVLDHVVSRILQAQDFLEQPLVLENVSSYISYKESTFSEIEFLVEIVKKTDCFLLVDINNIYVSAHNHAFNAHDYIAAIPADKVQQMHLAGHSHKEKYIIDTHDHNITDAVWQLYASAIQHFGLISTIIERDANIPPLPELLLELNKARSIAKDQTP